MNELKEHIEKSNAAKEFLKQVRLCDIHINNMLEEKARLKALALKITSTWGAAPVSGSRSQDKMGDAIAKIVDLEREIDKAVDEYVDKKKEVIAVLEKIQNPDQLEVLYKRYIQYESFEQISNEMGMTYRNVCNIHVKALQSVNESLEVGKTFQ